MNSTTLFSLGIAGLLFAAEASSEEFTILEGQFTDAASGEAQALTGRLEIRRAEEALSNGRDVYSIDDFELETDAETFLPSLSIEYNGQTALLLQIANQIRDSGDPASFFYFRSGGYLVGAEGDEVTFRFFDFRSSSIPLGDDPFSIPFRQPTPRQPLSLAPAGDLEGVEIPRRFDLHGTLEQVDERFRVVNPTCLEPPFDPLLPPGAVITAEDPLRPGLAGGGLTLGDTRPVEPTLLLRAWDPGLSGVGLSWNLQIVNVTFTPTLEELNITAPQGAEISLGEDGSLRIYTGGDLYLDGPIPEIQRVERIEITALGEIIGAANFETPPGVTLHTSSGANGDPLSPNPVLCGLLPRMRPIFPPEKLELGSFSMIAAAAPQAVSIELLSRRKPYQLRQRSRKPVWLAVFGSETLDVSEIDDSTLRLGPAGGQAIHRFGRPLVLPWDWNRDGHRDLLAVFKAGDLGVAHGEDELCLHAETEQGLRLEGCAEIESRARRGGRPSASRNRHERRNRH
jgi:hypothetical protein